MALHRERKRERFDPLILERGGYSFDHRFVLKSRIRILRNIWRLGWINARLTVNQIEPFGQIVIRRKLTIADRPCG